MTRFVLKRPTGRMLKFEMEFSSRNLWSIRQQATCGSNPIYWRDESKANTLNIVCPRLAPTSRNVPSRHCRTLLKRTSNQGSFSCQRNPLKASGFAKSPLIRYTLSPSFTFLPRAQPPAVAAFLKRVMKLIIHLLAPESGNTSENLSQPNLVSLDVV